MEVEVEVEVDRPWLWPWPWEAKVALALGSRGHGYLAMPIVAARRRVVPPSRGGSGWAGHQKHDCGCGRERGGEGGGRGGPAMVVALALGSQGGLSLGKPWPWAAMVVDMVGAAAVTWPRSCPWPWPWLTLWPWP